MSKTKVVVIDSADLYRPYPKLRDAVAAAGGELELLHCKEDEEAIDRCQGAQAIVVHGRPMRRALLSALPDCQLIVKTGVGFDNIDTDAATEKGIVVCNCPGYCTNEVADHTMALLLMLTRRMVDLVKVGSGDWAKRSDVAPFHTLHRMPGRVLGIVGFGRIGSAVARRAHGFGCKILANDPYVDFEALGYPYVQPMDLDSLLAEADIVTLHVPLTSETHGMIDANKLGLMKPTSVLINTSRGPVVDEQALSETLAEKRIAGAAIDVMVDEPPDPSSPLLKVDNLLITPHYGAASAECLVDLDQEAIDSVVAFMNGQWPLNAVNSKVVPKTTLARHG